MLPFEDGTSLSLLYHLNSEPWGNIEAYQSRLTKWSTNRSTSSSEPCSLPHTIGV